ncbi:hypothetical protein [Kitasatospora sp. NPDC098663]|uniref:hypothetical protein n=1 Tax=Kitasatospora sp. NPDC098663 TaxID=3364096 RepID=UPI00380AF485
MPSRRLVSLTARVIGAALLLSTVPAADRKAAPLVAAATVLGVALTAVPAGAVGIGDPYFPDDGNAGYDGADHDVRIAYDPARPDLLTGDTTATARALRSLDRLFPDLKGFQVSSVTVNGTPAESAQLHQRP